ncbi:MAG: peptidyl-prolyl cis-trans isomerase [Flavobacteriales bacterium]
MAMIEKIRQQGWLVLVMVGIGLLGFLIPYDAVMAMFGSTNSDIGEIDGTTINARQWAEVRGVRSRLFQYQSNQSQLDNETWNQLVDSTLYTDEFNELGLDITEEEYDAFVFGDYLSPFSLNTIYGGKDSTALKDQMRQNFEGFDETMAQGWKNLLIATRQREKYDAMLKRGAYANALDAKWSFKMTNDKVSIDYVVVPYNTVPDSTIAYTDADLKAYYNKHKGEREYKQEASRSVEFIKFPVGPSSKDSSEYQAELTKLASEFQASPTDSMFAALKTQGGAQAVMKYKGGFPEPYNTQVMNDSVGKVVGPFIHNNAFKIAKIGGLSVDRDSVQARHILLAEKGDIAKAKADSLRKVIVANNNFAEMAAQYGTDGTSSNGGDLGMFGRGSMVKPFEDACFNGEKGVVQIVETSFGVHLLEVTKKNEPYRKVSVIERPVVASQYTIRNAYQLARDFSQSFADTATFRNAADTLNGGTEITKAYDFKANAQQVSNIPNSGPIVTWAYGAEIGDVSQPFLIDENYIIAVLVDIKERGVPTFENIREKIKVKVIKEKKAEKYLELMKTGTLEEIAAACSTQVKKAENLTLKSNNIPQSGAGGNDVKVVGAAFGLKTGQISSPIVGEGGVYVIQRAADIVPGTSADNYLTDQATLNKSVKSRPVSSVLNSYKEVADIIDNRYGKR